MEIKLLESKIRDFIDNPRRRAILQKDSASWNELGSALDILGDTQLAIESYPKFEQVKSPGECYILIYGILQALLIQQDAVKSICKLFKIKFNLPKPLVEIRKIRNSSSGHPISQKEYNVIKSSFINRWSMSSSAFQIIDVFSNGEEHKNQFISIPDLITVQNEHISEILEQIVTELNKKEMEHREKYKSRKLVEIFPETYTYHIDKILQATYNLDIRFLGVTSLQVISKYLDDFKDELINRSEWGVSDFINNCYELLEYPISRLNEYLSGDKDNLLNEKDAYIFACFVSSHIEELKFMAEDLDKEYESTLPS